MRGHGGGSIPDPPYLPRKIPGFNANINLFGFVYKNNISLGAKHNAKLHTTPSSSPDPYIRPRAAINIKNYAKAASGTMPLRGNKASAATAVSQHLSSQRDTTWRRTQRKKSTFSSFSRPTAPTRSTTERLRMPEEQKKHKRKQTLAE